MISEAYCKKSGHYFGNTMGSRSDHPPSVLLRLSSLSSNNIYPLQFHKAICRWEIIGEA